MKGKHLFIIALALFAGTTAWAQSILSVNYIDENGTTQTVNATSLNAHSETPEFKKYVAEMEACGQMKLERFDF